MPDLQLDIGTLAGIDLVIIAAYMMGMMIIGSWFARYIHTSGDFFLAGRALPFWAVGFSIVASDIGAIDLVFGSGGSYKYGIAQANFDWIGSMPAVLFAAFIFIPYYWRAGVYTIPEFLGRRYNVGVQTIQAVIWLAFMAANVAMMLWTAAIILHTILGWDHTTAILVTAVLVGFYTVTGGLAAVVMTDVMQVIVMFIGTGALVVLSLWEAGGWGAVTERIQAQQGTEDFFRLLLPHGETTPYPWPGIVFGLGIIMSTAYFVGNQAVLQRALGARSEWDAKAGMLVAGLLKLAIPVLMFLPGIAARALHPDLNEPDRAVPLLVAELMPPGLTGLMFAAFFAAIMSSIDSYLNSCVTVFITDIYRKGYQIVTTRRMTDHHGLILGRFFTVALLIGGALCAPLIGRFETMYVALQTLLSLFQGPTLALLLIGILWPRATGWGGFAGLIVGVSCSTLLTILGNSVFLTSEPFLFVSIWSFLVAGVVTIIVSLLTAPEPPERLRGLVYGQVLHDPQAQELLQNRMTSSSNS